MVPSPSAPHLCSEAAGRTVPVVGGPELIVRKELRVGPRISMGTIGLQSGLRLALWARKSIARDSGLEVSTPLPAEFTLGHNVAAREDVDLMMEQARRAGATIVKAAQEAFTDGFAR